MGRRELSRTSHCSRAGKIKETSINRVPIIGLEKPESKGVSVSNFSPELDKASKSLSKGAREWRVILYNNNYHRFDDVVAWLQAATGCSEEFAIMVCNTCHQQGRAVCYQGPKEQCHEVATNLRQRKLQVEVDDY